METKKLTHIDVLEELLEVFISVEHDIADLVWFNEKFVLLEAATVLRESTQRVILKYRASSADDLYETGINRLEELPF